MQNRLRFLLGEIIRGQRERDKKNASNLRSFALMLE